MGCDPGSFGVLGHLAQTLSTSCDAMISSLWIPNCPTGNA